MFLNDGCWTRGSNVDISEDFLPLKYTNSGKIFLQNINVTSPTTVHLQSKMAQNYSNYC